VMTLTLDSYFDPQVEFGEVGVGVNGQRTWKVLGPDLDGDYGSLQGVGGLEATVQESSGLTTPVLDDYFGNVLATISSKVRWSPVRVGGYGPVLGYQSSTLTANTPLADTLVWRSRSIDPSGFYNLGARYYDPIAGHFLSPDPLGHAASMDLHSFCDGDPINQFDPTGRFGKGDFEQGKQELQTAFTEFAFGKLGCRVGRIRNGSDGGGRIIGILSGRRRCEPGKYEFGRQQWQCAKVLAI
jgi:RHS repeat-associated protein